MTVGRRCTPALAPVGRCQDRTGRRFSLTILISFVPAAMSMTAMSHPTSSTAEDKERERTHTKGQP